MATAARVFRRPWDTVLHRAVSTGVPAFFAIAAEMERDVPKFVERELNGYLECGQFERGFAKVQRFGSALNLNLCAYYLA